MGSDVGAPTARVVAPVEPAGLAGALAAAGRYVWLHRYLYLMLVPAALCGSLTLLAQAPQTPPPPPQQTDQVKITLTGGAQPKFAIAGFIPLSQDAETVAAAKTIGDVLDYRVRASSREAYCSPTRGAQGNALKTICAMPFCLAGDIGHIRIDADGHSHRIAFSVDPLLARASTYWMRRRMPSSLGMASTRLARDS